MGSWNPFNIEAGGVTHDAGGGNYISEYSTEQQGVQATANFIKQNDASSILADLQSGNTNAFLSTAGVGQWASHGSTPQDLAAESNYASSIASVLGKPVNTSGSGYGSSGSASSTTPSASSPSTSSGTSTGIMAKIGYWLIGSALLIIGLLILFHGGQNKSQTTIIPAGGGIAGDAATATEDGAEVAAA
jgi:hypothetical protein